MDSEESRKKFFEIFKNQKITKESRVKKISKNLDKYYNNRDRFCQDELHEAKRTRILTLGLIVTGVLIIFAGILLLYLDKISGLPTTVVGGILSFVLLRLHKDSEKRIDLIRKNQDEIEIDRIKLKKVEMIPDVHEKEKALQDLVSRLSGGRP